jgi:hypothetical protein
MGDAVGEDADQKAASESLQQWPGRFLPARPARCLAEAKDTG